MKKIVKIKMKNRLFLVGTNPRNIQEMYSRFFFFNSARVQFNGHKKLFVDSLLEVV